jgi:protein-tyrosine phosphatase
MSKHVRSKKTHADKIFPKLYLGGCVSASSALKDGISAVVNVTPRHEVPCYFSDRNDVSYLRIPISDTKSADSLSMASVMAPAVFSFIENCISNDENVLIHCQMGAHRSASVACAYIMYKMNLSYEKAAQIIKTARPKASPSKKLVESMLIYVRNPQLWVRRHCLKTVKNGNT